MRKSIITATLMCAVLGTMPAAQAMEPAIAKQIFGSLQLIYYRNFTNGQYVFTGFMTADNNPRLRQYQQIIPGHDANDSRVWPNGQALYKVPSLTLGTCLLYSVSSWGDMIGLFFSGSGGPWGPDQSTGGCADASGSPPTPANPGKMSSCDNPTGSNHFAVAGMNPMVSSMVLSSGIPGTKCDTHCNASGNGQPTYPCQAGMFGCAASGGPLCTPFPG